MRIGCHAVLFRDRIVHEGESIIAAADEIGYQGIEIGSRFYGVENRDGLRQLFSNRTIELSGMHVGTTLDGWSNDPAAEEQKILEVVRFLEPFPNRNVIMSCQAANSDVPESSDRLSAAACAIDAAADSCRQAGAKLHYHNHWWEFENEASIYNALRDESPSLSFALDLGWVEKSGADTARVLRELSGRLSYVHLRDLGEEGFVDLGSGSTDIVGLMRSLSSVLGEDGFLIVEYEDGPQEMDRYRRAFDYLARVKTEGGNAS